MMNIKALQKNAIFLFWGAPLGISLVLTACSSDPKGSDASQESAREESAPTKESSPVVSKEEPPVPNALSAPPPVSTKNQESARGLLSGISDGIKSQNDEAVARAATQVLSQNPSEIRALNAMGVYSYKKGRFLAAAYFFNRGLKVQQTSELMGNLALTQLALGEKREAIRLWRKSLELNPNDGIAAANLGSVYTQEKDYAKARIALESAVKRGVRDTKTLINYGIAQAAAGNHDSAKLMYEEALKNQGNNHEALLNYAILLIEHLNLRQEGLQQLDRLRFLGPDESTKKRMIELENRAKTEVK